MAVDRQYIKRLEEYIHKGNAQQRERARLWQTAIGLQKVDGLTVSSFLLETACRHIEGEITIREANQLIDNYYEAKKKSTVQSANSALLDDSKCNNCTFAKHKAIDTK